MKHIMKFLFKIFAIIMYRPKVEGKENIPKEGRGYFMSKSCA